MLSDIYNYRQLSDRVGTAGQPTAEQIKGVREAGFEVVINLALLTSDNALADEGSIVTGLGMAYVHLPVDFKAPSTQDFEVFCGLMKTFQSRRVFVHCAANMRVSAFMFLYRIRHEKTPHAIAGPDLHAVWEPDEVWSRFLKDQLTKPGA